MKEQGSLTYSLVVQTTKQEEEKKAQNYFTILCQKWSHDKVKQSKDGLLNYS